MPWLETDVRDQRIRFVIAASHPNAQMTATCRAFGISRRTGYKWLARHAAAGSVAGLTDQSRRPHHSPQRTTDRLTARVVALRETYGWGGEKLVPLLAAEGITLAARTIDRIIAREGLTRTDVAPAPAPRRFARAAPNELWQMDAKGHYPLPPGRRCHPLSILDDHSRFAVGLYALPTLHATGVQQALVDCFERYGVPAAMLMDHGTPWWATRNEAGLSRLSVFLLKQGIRLLHGRIRHPQTQGKVERFHRTLGERLRWWGVPDDLRGFERAFAEFRTEYNEVRPHEALGQQPPGLHFQRSPRVYVPSPPAWEYPSGSDVHRVDRNAMIAYQGHRFFVGEALIGEQVACTRLGPRVLVTYRHMYVRELELASGRTRSLLRPMDAAGPVDAKNAPTRTLGNAEDAFPTAPTGTINVLPMS
jgi:transposase InsO family protein